jgi:hypothetical protein
MQPEIRKWRAIDRGGHPRRREARYLLRSNLTEGDPAKLWEYYLNLVQIEEAFKTIKVALVMFAIALLPPQRFTIDCGGLSLDQRLR